MQLISSHCQILCPPKTFKMSRHLLILAVLPLIYGQHLQEITFHSYPNETHGDFLGLRHKIPDLTLYNSPILQNVAQSCGYGWWVAYTEKNYLGDAPYVFLTLDDPVIEPNCNERLVGDWTVNYSSLRYLGQPEMEKPSFSIYQLTEFRGEEVIVDGTEEASLPFPIASFMTTGHSEWALYTEENFGGEVVCYHSHWMMGGVLTIDNFYNGTLGSVRLGCPLSSDDHVNLLNISIDLI